MYRTKITYDPLFTTKFNDAEEQTRLNDPEEQTIQWAITGKSPLVVLGRRSDSSEGDWKALGRHSAIGAHSECVRNAS